MVPWRQTFLAALIVAACALSAATAGDAAGSGSFPCRWKYDFYVGLRAGYVTGGESADCGGLRGRLTLSAQLYRGVPAKAAWRLDRSVTRSWSNLVGNRFVEFAEPCAVGRVRARFSWVLRSPTGHVVAQNRVRSSSIADPGPKCAYLLR